MSEVEGRHLPLTEEEQLLKSCYAGGLKLKIVRVVPQAAAAGADAPQATAQPEAAAGPKRPKLMNKAVALGAGASSRPSDTIFLEHEIKHNILSVDFDTRETDQPLILPLEGVSLFNRAKSDSGKNTVVLWATMPTGSERFAFAIANSQAYSIADERFVYKFEALDDGQQNAMIVQSAQASSVAPPSNESDAVINGFPIERNRPFQLRLVLCSQGIAVFFEGRLVSEFSYRSGRAPSTQMYFICPLVDELSGKKNVVVLHRVWWGHTVPNVPIPDGGGKKRLAFHSADEKPPSPESSSALDGKPAERALFVAGLPVDGTAEQEMLQLFENYQIDSTSDGRKCMAVDAQRGQGVVKLEHVVNVERALKYLHNTQSLKTGKPIVVIPASKRQVPNWFNC